MTTEAVLTEPHDGSKVDQRRQLGAAMRRYRKEAGIDREAAAALIDVSGPTLSRKESGEIKFKPLEVDRLAITYGISADRVGELLGLAGEVRSGSGRSELPSFLSMRSRMFIELERHKAVEILTATLTYIPLYFQTERYMRALWLAHGEGLSPQRTDELVMLRKRRQEVLTKAGPPAIRAIIHEMAIRLPVGGPDVMQEQLVALAAACDLPQVEVLVQPIAAGAYPGMDSTGRLLGFADGPTSDLLQVQLFDQVTYHPHSETSKAFRAGWARRKASALDPVRSKALILGTAAEFAAENSHSE